MPDDRSAPSLPGPLAALRLQVLSIRQQAEGLVCACDAALATLEGFQVRAMPAGGHSGAPSASAAQQTEARPATAPAAPRSVTERAAERVAGERAPRRFATFDGPVSVPRAPGMPDVPERPPQPAERTVAGDAAEGLPLGYARDPSGDIAPVAPVPAVPEVPNSEPRG